MILEFVIAVLLVNIVLFLTSIVVHAIAFLFAGRWIIFYFYPMVAYPSYLNRQEKVVEIVICR